MGGSDTKRCVSCSITLQPSSACVSGTRGPKLDGRSLVLWRFVVLHLAEFHNSFTVCGSWHSQLEDGNAARTPFC